MIIRKRISLVTLAITLILVCIIISILLFPIRIDEKHSYVYLGIDCYISFDINQSLSNVSGIMDKYNLSSEIRYKRASPGGTGETVDFIYFSFNFSSSKNNSGYIYNFNTDNLTIKLHYYPDEHPDLYKNYKSEEEARELTYSRYLSEKNKFEPDEEHIISIFSLEFNSNPKSVTYIQVIDHCVIS
jgi:hypothetical protein